MIFGRFIPFPCPIPSGRDNKLLSQCSLCMINNHINTTKMIYCFYYIIYIKDFITHSNCISLKNISCLVMRQAASLNVIGIIGQLNLPRLKSRGSQPRILTDSDSLGYPRNSYGSYICYTPTRSPSFKMLIAAFASLSCTEPHSGHIHSLTDKSFVSVFLYPQQLQS